MLTAYGIATYFDAAFRRGQPVRGARSSNWWRALLRRLALAPTALLLIGGLAHDHEVAQSLCTHCLLVAQATSPGAPREDAARRFSTASPTFGLAANAPRRLRT
jgi:hypothetical protein